MKFPARFKDVLRPWHDTAPNPPCKNAVDWGNLLIYGIS
jgi:hypothetical protein